jgi:hypothetical protein
MAALAKAFRVWFVLRSAQQKKTLKASSLADASAGKSALQVRVSAGKSL